MTPKRTLADDFSRPVHDWFELSYSQYLTVPRSLLDAMPTEWQRDFVRLLEELDETYDWRPSEGRYWVCLKDAKGRYVEDPLKGYRGAGWLKAEAHLAKIRNRP